MAEERDAFGNPIEQRAPTGVPGKVPEVESAPAPTPVPRESTAYETGRPSTPTPAPGRRVRVGSLGTFSLVLMIFVIVIGAAAIGSVGIFNDVKDAWDDVSSIGDDNSSAPADVTGIDGESLFTPANFAEAKQVIAESGLGPAQLAALRPERLDAQLRKSGTVSNVQFRAGNDALTTFSTSNQAGGGLETFDLADVPDGAPHKAVVAAGKEFGLSTDEIDYIVIIENPVSGLVFNGFFKNGKHFTAQPDGSGVKAI